MPPDQQSQRARPGTSWRATTAHDFSWQSHARCLGQPTDVFFVSDGDRGARRIAREQRAKQICNLCPVLRDCLAYALNSGQQYGVWGSMTPRERAQMLIADENSASASGS